MRLSRRNAEIMAYRAPVEDIIFTLKHAAGFAKARADGFYQDLGDDDLDIVLGEAGRFASEVVHPRHLRANEESRWAISQTGDADCRVDLDGLDSSHGAFR